MQAAARTRSRITLAAALMAAAGIAAGAPPQKPAATVFATVGGAVITADDYRRALAVAVRQKYYHGAPPPAEYAGFQRSVADGLVDRLLLLAEARRRGIEPDRASVDASVAGYDARYGGSATWKEGRARMLAAVVPRLEDDSRLGRLEQQVRAVSAPDAGQLRAYYEAHRDLFVEPEQVKLSVILLKVDPSSRQPVWDAAHAEAADLHRRIKAGADFAELARLHSGDRSAANGGAMEYMHRGMLPADVQHAVDALRPGEYAAPLQVLEGVVILRLDARRPAQQRTFEQARARAAELWQRAEADARWQKLLAELRRATAIHIDESQYAPLRPPSATAEPG